VCGAAAQRTFRTKCVALRLHTPYSLEQEIQAIGRFILDDFDIVSTTHGGLRRHSVLKKANPRRVVAFLESGEGTPAVLDSSRWPAYSDW